MRVALSWCLATFLAAIAAGWPYVRLLKRYQIGKNVRFDGPASHQSKTGTPTMGGWMIIVPVLVASLLSGVWKTGAVRLILSTMMGFALLGTYDDWRGLHDNRGVGLLARVKFPLQVLVALLASLGLSRVVSLGVLTVPLGVFMVVGVANAVNMTDGLDGLAGGTVAIALAAYAVISLAQGNNDIAALCMTIVGALLGFLWYNVHPASLFMGDVGSLALGATLAMVALCTQHWLVLAVVGVVFAVETVSVALQVGYFKITGGRRLFRMAPVHHHFELLGWPEVQITQRFWLIGVVAALLGVTLTLGGLAR